MSDIFATIVSDLVLDFRDDLGSQYSIETIAKTLDWPVMDRVHAALVPFDRVPENISDSLDTCVTVILVFIDP